MIFGAEDQQPAGVFDVSQEPRQVTRMTGSDRMREDHGSAKTRDANRLRQHGRSVTQGSFLNISLISLIYFFTFDIGNSKLETSSGDYIYQKDEPMAANQVGHGESLSRLVVQVDHLRANWIEDVVGLVELRGSNIVAELEF